MNVTYINQIQSFFIVLLHSFDKQKGNHQKQPWLSLLQEQEHVYALQIRKTYALDELAYFTLLLALAMECDYVVKRQFLHIFKRDKATFQDAFLLYQSMQGAHISDVSLSLNEGYVQSFYRISNRDTQYYHEQSLLLYPWVTTYYLSGSITLDEGCQIINDTATDVSKLDDSLLASFHRCALQGMKEIQDDSTTKKTLIQYLHTLQYNVIQLDMHKGSFGWTIQNMYALISFLQRLLPCAFIIDMYQAEFYKKFIRYELDLPFVFVSASFPELQTLAYLPIPYDVSYEKAMTSLPFVTKMAIPQTPPTLLVGDKVSDKLHTITYMAQHSLEIKTALQNSSKQGTSVLFYGPSGCGKTLASQSLSYALQQAIWQVDLANVMDKYIGESEKHLARIFQEAQAQNIILLFDEADILFAKRTNIKDANDRYANASTAYLLQRMEHYAGTIVLTSNFLNNFDDAFLRRLQFLVRFPAPDEALRMKLWNHYLPKPFISTIDLLKLATVALSPARIAQCAERAFVYQRMENEDEMQEQHIAKAIIDELDKQGEQSPLWLHQSQNYMPH